MDCPSFGDIMAKLGFGFSTIISSSPFISIFVVFIWISLMFLSVFSSLIFIESAHDEITKTSKIKYDALILIPCIPYYALLEHPEANDCPANEYQSYCISVAVSHPYKIAYNECRNYDIIRESNLVLPFINYPPCEHAGHKNNHVVYDSA